MTPDLESIQLLLTIAAVVVGILAIGSLLDDLAPPGDE